MEMDESYRDSISTVDKEGKRKWVYPKKPKGAFTNDRSWVSAVLLLILFASPFIKIGDNPLLMMNVIDRKFVIFGQVFWPQDFHLFVIGMITLVVFIVLFTVVYGRIFCGWICPQTIFMEFVFRKIEYWIEGDYMAQRKLKKQDWDTEKVIKRVSKHFIFLIISALIMHTFMAYIIGVDRTLELIQSPPKENLPGFLAMFFLTGAFYFVFSWFREQVCTTVCPYGRLQGVLLDKNSIVVAYDYLRGEKRGKLRKGERRETQGRGDCIDCKQCVLVCPTGIDIRNGTQLECINCTACIDACDDIMDKVGFDKGLIRYASESNISEGRKFSWTTRTIAYSVVLVLLLGVFTSMLLIRSDVETTILRTPGLLYQEKADNYTNLYNFKTINKTNESFEVKYQLMSHQGKIDLVGDKEVFVPAQGFEQGSLFIELPPDQVLKSSFKIKIGVYREDKLIETISTKFLGPSL